MEKQLTLTSINSLLNLIVLQAMPWLFEVCGVKSLHLPQNLAPSLLSNRQDEHFIFALSR
jgi:hypothetical protein